MIVKCGKDLYLRELYQTDYDRIVDIVHACAAHSTRKLYHLYNDKSYNQNFRHNMNDLFEKDFLAKLRKNFNHFDDVMSKERIIYGSQQFIEFLNKIEDAFKFFPDDHLFFPYGPLQAPFKESVKEFLNVAIDTNTMENRRMFRMGIVVENMLIGCFTIDFNKHKILGYPNETTGDPGIFIIPDYRKNKNNGLERWKEVFSLARTIVKRFYPFNEQEILISATTHRVNRETGHILENGFKEYEGAVLHGNYGARRFFTINRNDFINKFNFEKYGYEGIVE